jgi:hypothetical protein
VLREGADDGIGDNELGTRAIEEPGASMGLGSMLRQCVQHGLLAFSITPEVRP